jgi:hypothetical protein
LDALNQEQLALYYGVGRYLSTNTRTKNWGKGFIEGVSDTIKKGTTWTQRFFSTQFAENAYFLRRVEIAF